MTSPPNSNRPERNDNGVLSPDAPKTPFPATTLFYVCMASAVLVTIGAVVAYVL